MKDERVEFLPEDVYSFLGHDLRVRSNSSEMLEHLRSMYGRFYVGTDDGSSVGQAVPGQSARDRIQIIDSLASSNELLLEDSCYSYRLSRVGDHCQFSRQDRQTFEFDAWGSCDPLVLVRNALLGTVATLTADYHLFHAGAVSLQDEGIVLAANPQMGKTTLVLKLVAQGCGFLSDEVACIDPDRAIMEPFPRKLNIRDGSWELLGLQVERDGQPRSIGGERERALDIDEIAPDSLSGPCKPGCIIFLRGFGDEPRLERFSGSNALFELLDFSISPIANPTAALFGLAPLLDSVRCFTLVVGDADETADLIMQLPDRSGR